MRVDQLDLLIASARFARIEDPVVCFHPDDTDSLMEWVAHMAPEDAERALGAHWYPTEWVSPGCYALFGTEVVDGPGPGRYDDPVTRISNELE